MTPKVSALRPLPLCVDLDGTLIQSDLLFESIARLLKFKPWLLLLIPVWLLQGKAALKRHLTHHVVIDVGALPYNMPFLDWILAEHARGRDLLLVTAADDPVANQIAAHLGIFSRVIASNGINNLKGKRKLEAIRAEIGKFEYAGDSASDLEVWRGSEGAVLVNAGAGLARRLPKNIPVVARFDRQTGGPTRFIKALRIHQWTKNLLIYVPLLTHLSNGRMVLRSTIGFILFSLCSSAQYLLNDLIDLDADRRHHTKRKRPFASGAISIRTGLVLAPALLAFSLVAAFFFSRLYCILLCVYFVMALAYSLRLKRVLLLDVFILSGLYTYRIIIGHLIIGVEISMWLISFSGFVFLSLAFSKRMTELLKLRPTNSPMIGRGYLAEDITQVNIFGVCSAFLAAVVFILYLQSERVRELYRQPELLWLLSPLFLYWISRTWLLTHRGQMTDDPVIFVLKDSATRVLVLLAGLIILAATRSWGIPVH